MPETESPECTCPPDDPNSHYSTCPHWLWVVTRSHTNPMTPQHPAAPETETDANGLADLYARAHAERSIPANGRRNSDRIVSEALAMASALLADLGAARERVRVVEGERDAARGDLVFSRQTTTNVMEALADSGAETLAAIARAESAEAAHEAEKAARVFAEQEADRLEADRDRLRKGIEALRDEWKARGHIIASPGRPHRPVVEVAVDALTALLGGGDAR